MIRFENVKKEYEGSTLLQDLNVTINDGDVVSVIGPSGNGKSTFIRLINLLDKPDEGKIFIDDKEITSKNFNITNERKKIGMMFQNFNLFNHMTVLENVMNPQIDVLNIDKKEAYENAIKYLNKVSMAEKADFYPNALSNGQKQRVALARTLVMNPDVILLDEPTSAIEPNMAYEVESILADLSREGKTIIIVTHDMAFAKDVSKRVFYIDEKTLYEEGTPEEIFDNPKRNKTKIFINNLKLLILDIESKNPDWWALDSEIDEYNIKNRISQKGGTRLKLAFEELVREIIINKLVDPKINIVVEYSNNKETLKMTVKYNGEVFDPKDTENELSYHVLKTTMSDINYIEVKDDEVFKNKVELIINNKI